MTDLENFATDIISIVKTGQRGGDAPDYLVKKITEMLQHGPAFTLWPRDAAEASQRVRDAVGRPKLPRILPPVPVVTHKPLPRVLGMPVVVNPLLKPGEVVIVPRPVITLPRIKP